MKLKIDYIGTKNGYDLSTDFEADIETDAESLGYAFMMCCSTTVFLETLMKKAHPKYHERIKQGIAKAKIECVNNDIWPFDKLGWKD